MTDHPILFSAPMIRALLEGRKTQTRRVLKPQPEVVPVPSELQEDHELRGWECIPVGDEYAVVKNLKHRPGDRLWVREKFAISGIGWGKKPSQAIGGKVHYAADPDNGWQSYWGNWRPSIHMPRWASRLTLTVTDVRVQRLQDISEADARAEGAITPAYPADENHTARELLNCYGPDCPTHPARSCNEHGCWGVREEFKDLWNSINGPDAWDANPWVVATSFEVHKCNIDQMGADND